MDHGHRPGAARASVDPVKQAARGLPGKKILIRFQRSRTPGRGWRALGSIPKLEVAQDLLDDIRVVDEADDA
jgi:hypothetical protein